MGTICKCSVEIGILISVLGEAGSLSRLRGRPTPSSPDKPNILDKAGDAYMGFLEGTYGKGMDWLSRKIFPGRYDKYGQEKSSRDYYNL